MKRFVEQTSSLAFKAKSTQTQVNAEFRETGGPDRSL
jgi:hypothetical protein